jgi:SAM-dependent methyltransferase
MNDGPPATKLDKQAQVELKKRLAAEARIARFKDGADWKHGHYSRREYKSYEAYVDHQVAKLDGLKKSLEARSEKSIELFRRRFELIGLKPPAAVLCLGARLGHEVAAFISLGHFAVGNDLYPGEGNEYVVTGDFHKLVFADSSVDCVYMNSVDHILRLEDFTREIRRVLKPGGIFAADVVSGYEEGFWAGEYEVIHWPKAAGFAEELARIGGFKLAGTRGLAEAGSPLWLQCIFKMDA